VAGGDLGQHPAAASLGIGNTPPTLLYGPGAFNLDLSLAKEFRLGESRSLEFRSKRLMRSTTSTRATRVRVSPTITRPGLKPARVSASPAALLFCS
jgi:hypothetical protein